MCRSSSVREAAADADVLVFFVLWNGALLRNAKAKGLCAPSLTRKNPKKNKKQRKKKTKKKYKMQRFGDERKLQSYLDKVFLCFFYALCFLCFLCFFLCFFESGRGERC